MLKKWLMLVLALSLVLVGCGKKDEPKKDESNKSEEQENEQLEVDKGLLDVTLTFPPSFFEDEVVDVEELAGDMKEKGVKEVKANDDGSVTLVISKSKHKELLKEMKADTEASLREIAENEDFPSIKEITHNKNFSQITMLVSKEEYENSMDVFAVFGLGMSGMIYQIFEGTDYDKINVQVNIQDADTKEVIESVTYPEGFENLQ